MRRCPDGRAGVNHLSKVHFEAGRGGRPAWREGGEVTRSNGACACHA